MKKVNIAIDGPSGAGKSSIAKRLAERLKYFFVNTGSLYRAIAYFAINQKIDITNEQAVNEIITKIDLKFDVEENIFINEENVAQWLRSEEISSAASKIAQYPAVREKIVEILQNFTSKNKGIIMDGRDTTFVVMPQAEVKIFLWASPEIRAQRRVDQNTKLGYKEEYFEVLEAIIKRDEVDMNREVNPLHQTEDAILVDSSSLSEDEVFSKILTIVENKCME